MKLKQLLYELGMLDKYAFADNSDISDNFYDGATEPNNDFENDLYNALDDWLWASKDIELYNLIKGNRSKLIKEYPKIFKPKTPNGTTLYRGITKVSDYILSAIDNTSMDDFEKSHLFSEGYKYKKPIKYTPNKLIQSWTSELYVAEHFKKYVILETKQNSEFFMNYDAISYIHDGPKEYECIHFDKSYSEPVFLHLDERLIKIKMFSNATPTEILKTLYTYNYKINSNGYVDVYDDVDISGFALEKIPIKFGKVAGDFYCSNNKLITLENSPKSVGGTFDCSNNPNLISLEGSPTSVGGNFYCTNTPKLKSLDYLPKKIGEELYSDIK